MRRQGADSPPLAAFKGTDSLSDVTCASSGVETSGQATVHGTVTAWHSPAAEAELCWADRTRPGSQREEQAGHSEQAIYELQLLEGREHNLNLDGKNNRTTWEGTRTTQNKTSLI